MDMTPPDNPASDLCPPPSAWPFGRLVPEHYRVILADPAWVFENWSEKGERKNPKRHYRTSPLGVLANLPVRRLADPAGCFLVMWCTWGNAARGTHVQLMKRWGFTPSSGGAWLKVTANGLPAFGTGYVLRDACEPFFTGWRGRLPARAGHGERNAVLAERREHSRKPEQMHEMLERLFEGPRCELFARRVRPGWDCWSDELTKGERER